MNSNIFWDVILCNLVQVYRQFGGTRYVHLQSRRITMQTESSLHLYIICGKTKDSEMSGSMHSPNLISSQLQFWFVYLPQQLRLYSVEWLDNNEL
jgi:hypothetical protein